MTSTANRHLIQGSNFDEIYRELLKDLSYAPQFVCSPRGQKIKENLAVTLVLDNPRARLLSCKKRNTNYGFAVGEFLWYWNGKNDLETMLYYNKRMNAYSDDGVTLNSAYGHRLKNVKLLIEWADPAVGREPDLDDLHVTSRSQWETAKQTLIQDSDSRRCVLHINRPADQLLATTQGTKDVPCTLSLQFFIRDQRLELHVHMRSNDVMWGLTYDLYSFTLFQECMLMELRKEEKFKDLELGSYYHTAGSLHLYEPHFQQAEDIVREYGTGAVDIQQPQEPLRGLGDLDQLTMVEQDLRLGRAHLDPIYGGLSPTASWMTLQLEQHRSKRDAEARRKSE